MKTTMKTTKTMTKTKTNGLVHDGGSVDYENADDDASSPHPPSSPSFDDGHVHRAPSYHGVAPPDFRHRRRRRPNLRRPSKAERAPAGRDVFGLRWNAFLCSSRRGGGGGRGGGLVRDPVSVASSSSYVTSVAVCGVVVGLGVGEIFCWAFRGWWVCCGPAFRCRSWALFGLAVRCLGGRYEVGGWAWGVEAAAAPIYLLPTYNTTVICSPPI